MAVTIIERPYKMSWSKNEIRYVFQLNNLSRVNLRLQVKLSWSAVSANPAPVELYNFLLKPDAAGVVYLTMQDYLDSLLSYVLPDPDASSMFTNADNQVAYYCIEYRELSDGVDAPAYDTTESDYTLQNYRLYVLRGGIEKHKHSRNNFFKEYNSQKFFFTWQPTDRMIDRTERIFLSVLNPSYTDVAYGYDYSIRITLEDVHGNSFVHDYVFDKLCMMYHIRLSLSRLNLGTLFQSELYLMRVALIDNATTYYLASYNYYFEFRPVYAFYDLLYHNSLGGIDFVRVKGEVDETAERITEEADAGYNVNNWNNPVSIGENIYSSLSLQHKYKGDVGYLRNKGAQYAFLELLVSKSIWQRVGWRWVQLVALQKSQELGAKRSALNSFPIEWALSETNETFTPVDFSIQQGDLN